MTPNLNTALDLYFIAGTQDMQHLKGDPSNHLLKILEQALEGGISCFQFRDKGKHSLASQPALQAKLAFDCRQLCRQYNVPFIMNDNVELGLAVGADGIHIGQSDGNLDDVIACLATSNTFLGLSINTLAQLLTYKDNPSIDYFGIGSIFSTASKPDHSSPLGIEFLATLKQLKVNKPCVAIGGIHTHNAVQIRQSGIDGIAVISAITQANDIANAIYQLKERD